MRRSYTKEMISILSECSVTVAYGEHCLTNRFVLVIKGRHFDKSPWWWNPFLRLLKRYFIACTSTTWHCGTTVHLHGGRSCVNGIHGGQTRETLTDEKIAAIRDALRPTNMKELKAYLGLWNYYGSFMQNLSTLLPPLHHLFKKGALDVNSWI